MRHVRTLGLCLVAVFAVSGATTVSALASGPPTVTRIEPNTLPTNENTKTTNYVPGATIWIHGTGFVAGAKVKIGASEAASIQTHVGSETLIEIETTPEESAGEYEVVVEDENGVSTGGPKLKFERGEIPNVGWLKFKNCPLHGEYEREKVVHCDVAQTRAKRGGFYTVGPITVPVTKTITLQGGATEILEALPPIEGQYPNMEADIAPEDGAPPIVPVSETVPAEVLNNVSEAEMNGAGWPQNLRESYKLAQEKGYFKANKTSEVIESAGKDLDYVSTFDILLQDGPGIIAKVQIKGENPWLTILGGSCQIGSEAEPILQHLTTGASTSPLTGEEIHGKAGYAAVLDKGEMDPVDESTVVDNTYAVPGAHGCGGSNWESFIDPVVNKAFGLPAPAGASTTVLEGALYTAGYESVEKRGL